MNIRRIIPIGNPLVIPVIAALAALAAVRVTSAAEAAEEGKRLLETFVTEVQSMSGRFEQTLVSAEGETMETSSGTFAILRPGRFRWVYQEPYEQILVADGTNVWNYDVDLEQVTVKPQEEALGSTPAALLGGSAGVLDGFEVEGSTAYRGTVYVTLKPETRDTSFEKVELGFTDGVLTRMMLFDDLDQVTLVTLHDVQVNEDIDRSLFDFSPPEHVDVVGQPVTGSLSGQ